VRKKLDRLIFKSAMPKSTHFITARRYA